MVCLLNSFTTPIMATKSPYQTTFEIENFIQPLHTGGSVSLDQRGLILATCLGEDALLTDLNTGKELARIEGDGELISTLMVTTSASHLIVCSRSLSMRIYALKQDLTSIPSLKAVLLRSVKPHSSPVVVLAIDKTSTLVATGSADGMVKVYDIRGGFVTHNFPVSNVLVTALHFFELVASQRIEETGISARSRKIDRRRSTGQHEVEDAATGKSLRLACGNDEGKVRIWDLYERGNKPVALDSHSSSVSALDYSAEGNTLITASRDQTVMWWDTQTWKVSKVVPVLEQIEAAGFLNRGRYIYTGGANGCIRVWYTESGREITRPQQAGAEENMILRVVHFPELPFILSVHLDHTLVLHSIEPLADDDNSLKIASLPEIRRISGDHDQIIDLGYVLPDKSLLALATNSEDLRIITLSNVNNSSMDVDGTLPPYFGADVAVLTGHTEIIICLDIDWSGHWIATGAKDNTAKLWRIDPENSSFECYATFTGHAESLGAIALPRTAPQEGSAAHKHPLSHPPKFLLTGSKDLTVKRWEVPAPQNGKSGNASRALFTRKAHEKDINALDANHSSTLFASASQDKTVKIWSIEEGEAIGVLRGHRRGVWSIRFAPKDTPVIIGENGSSAVSKGMILTGSGDKTVKIWSLSDYSCLRTFEGHTSSVLKVAWLNLPKADDRGRRHIKFTTAGGDGLVKVWDANTGEMECTLDNHTEKVWALTVHPTTNTIVSGSGDSTVTFWKDTTAITQEASATRATQFVEQDQELQNHIRAGSYRSAITLALQLNHPARLLSLFTNVTTSNSPEEGSLSGLKAVDEVLRNLADEQLYILLLRIRDWNANARTAPIAQKILWTLVKSYPAARLSNLQVRGRKGAGTKDLWNALKIYTEKHYRRMEELVDESYLVEYTLREMDGIGENVKALNLDHDGDIVMEC